MPKHRLQVSGEFGVTCEWTSVYGHKWTPERHLAEWPTERQLRAYFEDNLRKKAIMMNRAAATPEKVRAVADVLTRWSALPNTSMLLVGGHGAKRETYAESIDPRFFERELAFHSQNLKSCGTLAYHPNFAYAPDVEAPGTGANPKAKREAQARLVEALRKTWKGLTFVVSSGDWSSMSDPTIATKIDLEKIIYRAAMYTPYAVTHSPLDPIFCGHKIRYGITAKEAEALIESEPRFSERAKELIREAVGFGRPQIKASIRALKSTGLPFVIQESGEYCGDGRYTRDVVLEAKAEYAPLRWTGPNQRWPARSAKGFRSGDG